MTIVFEILNELLDVKIIPQDEGKDKDDYDLYRLMSMSCMMYSNLLKTN